MKDFNVTFANLEVSTIPYCAHDITCRSATYPDHGAATWTGVHYKLVQTSCEGTGIVNCEYKK